MNRNLKLLKIILPLNSTWFWSGIWLLYYLRFTDYSGVGLIYGIMVPLGLLLEIPTGAITDLIGKKKTLIIAFLFNALASLFIGISTDFNQLLFSVLFSVIAGALYSGTAEALIYDSLKSTGKENEFDLNLASIEKISLVVMALASISGGFLYTQNVQLPWFLRSLSLMIGMIICFFLIEPPIDSEKFFFKNFINQNKQGFVQIFSKATDRSLIIKLILIISFIAIITEEIESAFAIEIGYSAEQLGVLFALIPLISFLGYHFYPQVKRYFSKNQILSFGTVIILVSTLVSPLLTFISGTAVLLIRRIMIPFVRIISSDSVNAQIEPKYRTTTLSTFNLFTNLPYAISPIIIGSLLDRSSSSIVMLILAVFFSAIILGESIFSSKHQS